MSMASSITIMPETDDKSLCLTLTGTITKDEYQRKFAGEVAKRVKATGAINLLVNYDADYEGWEPDAAKASFTAFMDQAKFAKRVAYVNPPKKKILQIKLTGLLGGGGEVRFFNPDELNEAVSWTKTG